MVWKNVFGLYASTRKNHCFDCDMKGSSYNASRLICEYIRYVLNGTTRTSDQFGTEINRQMVM